jgi:hypothetical protein
MTIAFAYEVGWKVFIWKVSRWKVTSDFGHRTSFGQYLESSNSKQKIEFFSLLYFQFFLFFYLYWIILLDLFYFILFYFIWIFQFSNFSLKYNFFWIFWCFSKFLKKIKNIFFQLLNLKFTFFEIWKKNQKLSTHAHISTHIGSFSSFPLLPLSLAPFPIERPPLHSGASPPPLRRLCRPECEGGSPPACKE